MRKLNFKNFEEQKGITLVALVITIIVLLILAGVTITYVFSDNGIISQAQKATSETDIATTKEQIRMELVSKFNGENYTYTVSDIEEAVIAAVGTNTLDTDAMTATTARGNVVDLSDLFETADIPSYEITTNLTGVWADDGNSTSAKEIGKTILTYTTTNAWRMPGEVTVTGANYTWDPDKGELVLSNVTGAVSVEITASAYYGATVSNYTVSGTIDGTSLQNILDNEGITWKIFYADDDYTYLIASDYIPSSAAPSTASGYAIYKNSTYKLSFDNVYKDYTGSASVEDEALRSLNSNYYAYIKANSASTYTNIRSVAYMMDQTIWNIYKDSNNYAEYVVAGPTVELLFKSYNEKYGTNYSTQVSSLYGYEISNDGSAYATSYSGMLSKSDDIYVISSITKAYGMWLASPSGATYAYPMHSSYAGVVGFSYSYPGLRPLVLLKSSVTLELQDDGTYKIQ